MQRYPAVYILASKYNGTLYVGVTGDLIKRTWQHKEELVEGFTKKYNVHDLVYYELFDDMANAIAREKCMKKWCRAWKIKRIEKNNPTWKNLWAEIIK